jgi:hypothetical protein
MRSTSSGATPVPVSFTDTITPPEAWISDVTPSARAPVGGRHRFDRIRGQVQKHLLELYAIPVHPWQRIGELDLNRNPVPLQLVADRGENTPNDLVDVERGSRPDVLLEHCANAGDDGSCTMTIGRDVGERSLRLLEIGNGTSEPVESGVGIRNHRERGWLTS